MSPNSADGPTALLQAWSQGDGSALDRLMPLVYDELHGLAQRYMRQERPDHTLQATFDARMSQVVELRFFGGLTLEETAQVLNLRTTNGFELR